MPRTHRLALVRGVNSGLEPVWPAEQALDFLDNLAGLTSETQHPVDEISPPIGVDSSLPRTRLIVVEGHG